MIHKLKYQFYRFMCNITFGKVKEFYKNKKFNMKSPDWVKYKFTNDEINFLIQQEPYYPQNIYDTGETIRTIVENNMSCSRIGDGEFLLMQGKNGVFGNENPKLREKLLDICRKGSTDKCLVCINPFHLYNNTSKWFCWYYLKNIKQIYKTIQFNKDNYYGDAYSFWGFVQKVIIYDSIGMSKVQNKPYLNTEHLEYLSKLWNNKHVVFVTRPDSLVRKDSLNLYRAVLSKHYVNVPAENCYSEYNRIFAEITSYPKDYLIYLECGEVATVLAYELSEFGYQAIDIGNLYERIVKHTIPLPNVSNKSILYKELK